MERFKVGQRVITAPHAWRWPNCRGTVVEESYAGAAIVAVDGETRENFYYGFGEIVRAGYASTTGAARGGSLRQSLQKAQERHADARLEGERIERRLDAQATRRAEARLERAAERRIRERR